MLATRGRTTVNNEDKLAMIAKMEKAVEEAKEREKKALFAYHLSVFICAMNAIVVLLLLLKLCLGY